MNKQRKKIILSEINYWKVSKLLPDHYCNFLIALYSNGNENDDSQENISKSVLVIEKRKQTYILLSLLLLTVISCTSIFLFVNFPIVILGITAIIVFALLLYAMLHTKEKAKIIPFLYISSAFILLAMSLKLWNLFFQEHVIVLMGLLIVNCLLWLFAGRLLKLLYFTISGIAGILLIIGFLIAQF